LLKGLCPIIIAVEECLINGQGGLAWLQK